MAKIFTILGGSLAAGWGMILVLLMIGYIWGILEIPTKTDTIIRGGIKISTLPGAGLWIGLIVALGIVGVAIPALLARRGLLGMIIGLGSGFLIGLLWMLLDVHPWDFSGV